MVNLSNSKTKHKAAEMYAEELKAGKLSRREFLARTTALGVTTAAAYTRWHSATCRRGWPHSARWHVEILDGSQRVERSSDI